MDDATLKALLAEDGLPERDAMFTYAVMQKVARRRLTLDLLDLAPLALAAAALLWVLIPQADAVVGNLDLGAAGPMFIAAVISLSLLIPMSLGRAARMTET